MDQFQFILKNKNEMSINPLYEILPKKNYISNPKD